MSNLIADWRDRPTHRRVWALAAPMILSNISVPLVALVDSPVIGPPPHPPPPRPPTGGPDLFPLLALARGGVGRWRQSAIRLDMRAPWGAAL